MTPQDRILDHYENPYHRYVPPKSSGLTHLLKGTHTNESCGDYVKVWIRINYTSHNRIVGIWWEGYGCCFSQAMASMLAEHCEAKRLYEVRAFTQDDMLNLFGLDVEPGRVECVMVAHQALMKALERHDGI